MLQHFAERRLAFLIAPYQSYLGFASDVRPAAWPISNLNPILQFVAAAYSTLAVRSVAGLKILATAAAVGAFPAVAEFLVVAAIPAVAESTAFAAVPSHSVAVAAAEAAVSVVPAGAAVAA